MSTMRAKYLFLPAAVAILTACTTIPNARKVEVMVNGNCEQCEATIEGAALLKGVSKADWDPATRHAIITYDSTRTSDKAVLQRIADAGYDNADFLAPDSAYERLPDCCQYERTGQHIGSPTSGDTHHGH